MLSKGPLCKQLNQTIQTDRLKILYQVKPADCNESISFRSGSPWMNLTAFTTILLLSLLSVLHSEHVCSDSREKKRPFNKLKLPQNQGQCERSSAKTNQV